ncbi:MAG: type II toxin-antitoxin system PemK/MazF family toxin [Alkalinema sp. RL_2_19]|nr:type II toxin-antitoxin system PemK/MazF family toxin [Alkalinema sp. RL_2_19]
MRALQFGDVLNIRLPSQSPQGHEQEGLRPAIVVGLPERAGKTRFPVVFVVPVTSDRGQDWANAAPLLYPRFSAGSGGLRSASIRLLDQLRCVDVRRIVDFRGSLSKEACDGLRGAFQQILDFD